MFVSCESCMLSGTGLCDKLIPCPGSPTGSCVLSGTGLCDKLIPCPGSPTECMLSRNLMNEEIMAPIGLHYHRKKQLSLFVDKKNDSCSSKYMLWTYIL